MLQDGEYIESRKPQIGAHYIPSMRRKDQTPEEIFAQNIILNIKPEQKDNFFSLIGRILKI
jgi:hypothetical protein